MDAYTPLTQYVVTRDVMLTNDVLDESNYQQKQKSNCKFTI